MGSYTFIGADPGKTFVAGDEEPKLPLRLLWRSQGIDNCAMTAPLKDRGRIVVCDDAHGERISRLYCFDAATGQSLWQLEQNVPGLSRLGCLVDGVALFSRADEYEGHLRAFRIEDGSLAWEHQEMHAGGDAIVVAGRVILSLWERGVQHVAVIQGGNGDILWRRRYDNDRWPIAVGEGMVLLSENDPEQPGRRVACVSLQDGSERWRTDVGEIGRWWDAVRRESVPGGTVSLSAIGKRAYCSVVVGKLACMDLWNGNIVWTRGFDLGSPSTPIPADGKLYFTTMDSFHCLEAFTGRDVFSVGGITEQVSSRTSGFIAGDYYFYAADCSVIALDRHTGKKVWRYDAESVFTPPFFSDGCLYTSCLNGHVYCFGSE
jgi:outer membrane protein assembly factor BamB